MYRLHKFLWELRRNPVVADRFRADPTGVLRSYGLPDDQIQALLNKDLKRFYDAGLNPYLLYFGAMQMGVSRAEYYERLRATPAGAEARPPR